MSPVHHHVLGHPKQYKNQPKCWFFIAFCFIASNIVLSNPNLLGHSQGHAEKPQTTEPPYDDRDINNGFD